MPLDTSIPLSVKTPQLDNPLDTLAKSLSLQSILRKQQHEEGFRRDIAALGPQPTQEQLATVASKYADPEKLLQIHQTSQDRKAAAADRALQFAQTLDLRQGQLDLQRDALSQKAGNDAERLRVDEWYKGESLRNAQARDSLQAQLRLMGFEIQRQGQQLQLSKFDADKREREHRDQERQDKEIEQQIGKTADRMKDLSPVMSAANQLNSVLSQYSPQNVPGVGYLKNTDIGKMFLSDRGKDVSASIKLFGNSVLKAMSGAAVTAPEEIRQMAAQMADGRFSSEDFFIAWPKMAEWVNTQVALGSAGLTPKARERFSDRTGVKLEPITPRFVFDQKSGTLRDTRAAQPGSAVPPPPPGFQVTN